MLSAQQRMAWTERITLPHGGHCDMSGYNVFDRAQNGLFALLVRRLFKLIIRIKMVFNRLFAGTGHQDYLPDARCNSFLNHVLDNRLVIHG